jgi:hypothetical protein
MRPLSNVPQTQEPEDVRVKEDELIGALKWVEKPWRSRMEANAHWCSNVVLAPNFSTAALLQWLVRPPPV